MSRVPSDVPNSSSRQGRAPDDPRLVQVVQEYLAQFEAGMNPDRQQFINRHPDLSAAIAECLDGLQLVHQAMRSDPPPRLQTGAAAVDLPIPGGANLLGDFRIVREIGRGGMGIVYEAEQLSLGRRVALKVMSFAATFDSRQLQRFRNEAQAAAQLHHTNIVPVFAVGSERGVHFYAMQLIEGQSLAVLIRHLRQQAGIMPETASLSSYVLQTVEQDSAGGTRAASSQANSASIVAGRETASQFSAVLSTQHVDRRADFHGNAARLIGQAAQALEHAHDFGIVHRDIKPANLLVDSRGSLWVTDFGLAQFQADVGLTQSGDILGTMRYMSPEQASGQRVLLDHRTDI
ncbi:MAG TPA: serine/threonine-protein kinase, partial [Planctomycetaceae bacterium]|nr:serine/threonine-protein kinase [Planctomycetaceae bacterium]